MNSKVAMVAFSVNESVLRSKLLSNRYIPILDGLVDRIIVTSYDNDKLAEEYKDVDPAIKWIKDKNLVKQPIGYNRLAYIQACHLMKYEYVLMIDDDFVFGTSKLLCQFCDAIKAGTKGMINFSDHDCSQNLFHTWMRCGMLINISSWLDAVHKLEDCQDIDFSMDKFLDTCYHEELIFASILWLGGYDVTYLTVDGVKHMRAETGLGSQMRDPKKSAKIEKNNVKRTLMEMGLIKLGDEQGGMFYPLSQFVMNPSVTNESWLPLAYEIRNKNINK